MSNIFNFKRFGAFFLNDLRNAKNQWGLSFLICCLMPAMVFFLVEFASLVRGEGLAEDLSHVGLVGIVAAFFVTMITSPSKIYGHLTNKKAGTDYVLMPASLCEKTLSMIIVSALVVPVALALMLLGVDAVMGLIFPSFYGAPIISEFRLPVLFGTEEIVDGVSVNFVMLYITYCVTAVLPFLLGAIVFKKSKAAKTILVLMGISIISTIVGLPFIEELNDIEKFLADLTPSEVVTYINNYLTIIYAIYFVVLSGLIFLRLKTIKH